MILDKVSVILRTPTPQLSQLADSLGMSYCGVNIPTFKLEYL